MFIWTISDIIGMVILALIALVTIVGTVCKLITQRTCKHTNVWENGQCHAICRKCDKDLGFIGTWREKQKAELPKEE